MCIAAFISIFNNHLFPSAAFWSFLFFIGFCYLTNQWGKADDPPNGEGVNNVQASIVFSFFSIFTWAGCAYFAFLRFKAGVDPSFSSTYESDPSAAQQYAAYPASNENDQFQEAPFSGQQQQQQQQQRGMYTGWCYGLHIVPLYVPLIHKTLLMCIFSADYSQPTY